MPGKCAVAFGTEQNVVQRHRLEQHPHVEVVVDAGIDEDIARAENLIGAGPVVEFRDGAPATDLAGQRAARMRNQETQAREILEDDPWPS